VVLAPSNVAGQLHTASPANTTHTKLAKFVCVYVCVCVCVCLCVCVFMCMAWERVERRESIETGSCSS